MRRLTSSLEYFKHRSKKSGRGVWYFPIVTGKWRSLTNFLALVWEDDGGLWFRNWVESYINWYGTFNKGRRLQMEFTRRKFVKETCIYMSSIWERMMLGAELLSAHQLLQLSYTIQMRLSWSSEPIESGGRSLLKLLVILCVWRLTGRVMISCFDLTW